MISLSEELLEPEEVATMLRINPQTVKRLANKGEIPGLKVGGQWRFRREAIEEYLRKQEQKYQQKPKNEGE